MPALPLMLILFDHVTPKGIARSLVGHTVIKAKDRGWDTFSNGDLLAITNTFGFVTCARNWALLSARAYWSGAGAASQDRGWFGAFVPVS